MSDVVLTASEEETSAAGERLARRLNPGDLVLLYGDLGAGKTAFVRGMARGIGASDDDVSSPTFTLVQEYHGRVTLYHVDLYRVSPIEADDLGLDELLSSGGIVAVEWAERWRSAPPAAIHVRIDDDGENRRRIALAANFNL